MREALAKFIAILVLFLGPIWLVMGLIVQSWRWGLAIALTITLLRMWQLNWMRGRV